ncbi:MAG: WbuC family cupin fold metalloprotein [Candidatus Symbiothrix sp.]|jgi:cupin fold WbuC family metalloprotein|nr:WbuC family cupin fold metalloprotein [Candidatus Symbiothrix sp.]
MNSKIQLINKSLLDSTTAQAKTHVRLRMNYNIHSDLNDPVNRMLNALEPGTVIPIHRHLHPYKNESFVILRGELDVLLYDDNGQIERRITLNPEKGNYGMDIPGEVWHSLEVKQAGTMIYEVKHGPFAPIAEEDLILG